MPLRVVGMLFGIPEDYQHRVQEDGDKHVRTERGGQMTDNADGPLTDGQVFAEFIDWRIDHPADDLTTELLNAEFEDETGTTRKLHRDELLVFMNVVAVAGAETTTRLIGWTGKLLSEHPDQRRQLVADRSLLSQAIEEILRFEPPALQMPATSPAMSNSTVRPCRKAARSWRWSVRPIVTNANSAPTPSLSTSPARRANTSHSVSVRTTA